MDNEELMEQLRMEAEEYGEVTKAIQADMGDINPDALAVYYRAKTTDNRVLLQALEDRYGAADVGRFNTYFDSIAGTDEISSSSVADPLADKGSRPNDDWDFEKDQGLFGKVASGTLDTIVDTPDMLNAGMANYAKSFTINSLDGKGGELLMGFNKQVSSLPAIGPAADFLGITRVTVDVTPQNDEDLAGYQTALEGYQWNNKGLDQMEVGKKTRLKLTPDQLDAFNAYTGQEGLQATFDTLTQQAEDADARLDTAVSKFGAGLTEFAAAYATVPGGGAQVGRAMSIGLGMLRGVAADKMIIDKDDQNLAALAEELGVPGDALWDIIATDADDAQWKNELRIIAEGAALGGITEGLFEVIGAARKINRGADPVEAIEQAAENSGRILSEAAEARRFTADEINNAKEVAAEVDIPAPAPAEVPTVARDLLTPPVAKASTVQINSDKMLDTLIDVDLDDFTDENIESLSGIRKFSGWSNWDDVAGARIAINEHLTGLFDQARKGQTVQSMIEKTEKIRQKQLKDGSPDWAKMVITDEVSAKAYVNNMIVEKTISGQVNKIADWVNNGSRAAELPDFLKHLEFVDAPLRKKAVAAYTSALFEAATVVGKKNQTQISEHARALVTQRWIKAGALKEAELELDEWLKSQKAAGNVEFEDLDIGLKRITEAADGTLGTFRQMVAHVAEGAADQASALVRFRNANMLANHKTMAINAISEAFGHTQAGIISRIYQGITSVAKGRPLDGAARVALGATFAIRQFSQFGKAISNAGQLFAEGIGEVSGSASAFDSAGKGIGKTFGDVFSESSGKFTGTLNVATAGVNRTIAAISEVFSSMAVYQKMQDDALLGAFGDKYRDLAAKGLSLRAMSREEITQMFVDTKHPGLLLRRTRSNNLIDKGAADNAAIIGFREDAEFDGLTDKAIGAVRRAAYESKVTAALFNFFAPFAKTIAKISRRSLLNGLPAPLWFMSTSFRKRFNSKNPAVRQLARAEFALNSMAYTTFLAKGLMDEDHEEARLEKIASLKNPGDSVVMFEPIDEVVGFGEDYQGWVKVTMQEDGELKTSYVLPQELNIVFSTAIAAQSTGTFLRSMIDNDGTDKTGWGHYMQMAALAGASGITQNNLVGNFVDSIERTFEAGKTTKGLATFVAMNMNSFTPAAPAVRHLSADYDKMFGDGETMQFNSKSWDDIRMKAVENFAYGAAFRQLTRQSVHEYLNVKRGPFGTPLPTRGRGLALIAKEAGVGQGELLFAEFLQNEIGRDPTRLAVQVIEGGIDLKQIRVAMDQHSLGDKILENLRDVTIEGQTIDERMLYEFTSPDSKLAIMEGELLASVKHGGVNREGVEMRTSQVMTDREDYLLSIHRAYLNASKEQIMYEMDDKTRAEVEDRIAQASSDYDLKDKFYGAYKDLINSFNEEEGQ